MLQGVTLTERQLEEFLSQSASLLRGTRRDEDAIRAFLVSFLRTGRHAGLSQGELIDYLAVSDDSVLDRAELDAHAQEQAMAILGALRDDELL
jgi:hypothetical protein